MTPIDKTAALQQGVRVPTMKIPPAIKSTAPFVVIAIAWQAVAMSGTFPSVLFPSLGVVVSSTWKMMLSGALFMDIGMTLYRMGIGFLMASVLGIGLGLAMGRFSVVETFFRPILTVLLPVPALAWLPLFILWFGLGDRAAICLVLFTSAQYVTFNTWMGVRTINPVLLQAASSLNIRGPKLLWKVILPAALPSILTGLRLGLAAAWRADVAGEMISATNYGLGYLIFSSREFLQTDVMLGAIIVIAVLGLTLERFTFRVLERKTAERWGMVSVMNEPA